jgi:2,3-bisphosphoglycerate-dependent phosphoglycerate mutase
MLTRPFYYVRHGQTEANVRGFIAGSMDVPLTVLGLKQANAAARVLAREPITAIYSSPLRRARDSAEPLAKALGLNVNVLPELSERRRGELEGQAISLGQADVQSAAGETFPVFTQRVLRGLSRIDTEAPVLVAHRGVFLVLCDTLGIHNMDGDVPNGVPLRFRPVGKGAWIVERVS